MLDVWPCRHEYRSRRGPAASDPPAQTGDPAIEAGRSGREPAAPVLIDDRWVRAVGIPAFGVGIPRITRAAPMGAGAGPARHGPPAYWLGSAAFRRAGRRDLATANRWLLFEQRRHWELVSITRSARS